MQGAETVLGPIQEVSAPTEIVSSDPSEQQQTDKQEKDSEKNGDDDDGSASAALGLINTGPVQLKGELEQPVTSGGMDTMIDDPGTSD